MQKMYYSIKEASELLDLPAHVLRYWETEFKELSPRKNRGGNRIYRENDIQLLHELKELLHERRFTIEGARNELKRRRSDSTSSEDSVDQRSQILREARQTIREVLELLDA
ncbi:MerR family transcriptional regulator [bacterium]|nr:MerR family transcriptional regulator [bacterium]